MKNSAINLLAVVCASIAWSSIVRADSAENIYKLSLEDLVKLKVDSASGFTESLTETPVPVTIITESMIRNSAALSLRDILSQYVPGFTQVQDQNEYNIAFRGVYTSSQQKILILLNGKRLNSRSYSSADPAFGINLDKLSQIEVIRGPGSSVYGNVALTAVINLKLKSAIEVDAFKVKLAVGNHGLKSLYTEWSSLNNGVEYMAWASIFETKGELVEVSPQNDYSPTPSNETVDIRLDSFDSKPSTDIGFSFKSDQWSSYLSFRESHYIEPLSGGALTGEAYDFRNYPQKGSNAPGADFSWFNFNVENSYDLGEASQLVSNAYIATSKVSGSFVLSPSTSLYGTVLWKEQTLGTDIKWKKSIVRNQLLLGAQFESNEVKTSNFVVGQNLQIISQPFNQENPVLLLGKESVLSIYSEYKHYLSDHWLVNAGGRYDDKNRLRGKNITELSPRLALVYQQPEFNFKLGYSRSFVDPPYWNRYSSLASFRGSEDLKPEILQSYQISQDFLWMDKTLSTKFNFFYNYHSDFVFRNREATAEQPLFANSGKMETFGLEQEWHYQIDNHSIRMVTTYQKVSEVQFYDAANGEIFNIPKNQVSLSWDSELTQNFSSQLFAQYLSSRSSPIRIANNNMLVDDPFPNQGVSFEEPSYRLPSVVLLHAKLRWKFNNLPLEVSMSVQNLTNKKWQQGGSTIHPYPQTGRWAQLGLTFNW